MKLVGEPQKVLDFFYAINQIPRPSNHEKAISDFLVNFAKERNLEVYQDEFYNVIINKPATPGYENRPSVILQGHMDMVPEKTKESTHNFETDPIEMTIEDGWIRAKDTTLGADNGIAVAMTLAVLDSNDIEHGPLQALFTATEETGMDGAANLDPSKLHGQYLLNLDTEEEEEFIVGCAGGMRLDLKLPLLKDHVSNELKAALQIHVHGLKGGHSGIEIHQQRANANQLLARILFQFSKEIPFEMAFYDGGTKHNAITNEATTIIAIREDHVNAIKTILQDWQQEFRHEFSPQDPDILVEATEVPVPELVYAPATMEALVNFFFLAPHGVVGMSQNLPGLVETSLNLAIAKEADRTMEILISIRSSNVSSLSYLKERIIQLSKVLGITAAPKGSYPAWEYRPGGTLEQEAATVYERVFGRKPEVKAVHAGLECGLLGEKLPNTQMLSFGPTIKGAHTPREKANVESIRKIYEYLLLLLKELK